MNNTEQKCPLCGVVNPTSSADHTYPCNPATTHIHVGHNMPGYLPESDVMCCDSIESALDALRHEIKNQQDCYYEQCAHDEQCDCDDGAECECEWCDVATDCEAALSAIADGDAAWWAKTKGSAYWLFSPPEGADMAHWASVVEGVRESCEIYAEQES